jgi:hypothetical protein
MAFFLLRRPDTLMRVFLTFRGLMLLCAPVVTGEGTLIGPAQTQVHVGFMSEPAGLVALGAGFVLLAHQLRRNRKKC